MNNMFVISAYTAKFNATGWLIPIGMIFGLVLGFVFGSPALAIIFVLVLVLDFATGVMKAIKQGEKVTSSRIRDMWFKWAAYLFVLLTSACVDRVIASQLIHAAAFGFVILSEGVSILENCEALIGKKLPFLGKIRQALDALKNNGANHENSDITNHTLE